MELFSELYGIYYHIATDLLNHTPLTRSETLRRISKLGFAESALQMAPKLFEKGAWPLFIEQNGLFHSRLEHPVRVPVSTLELRWLRAALLDPRAKLFLSESSYDRLSQLLADTEPLYQPSQFRYFDRYLDGDDYRSDLYSLNFKMVLSALRSQVPLAITYLPADRGFRSKKRLGIFLPLSLEYSEQDDKFRIHCLRILPDNETRPATLNLNRILKVSPAQCQPPDHLKEERCFPKRCNNPVVVKVFPERNAVERFLVEFSPYEKRSETDGESGICTVSIWYPEADESAVLIRILGFGPTVRVISPVEFVEQVKYRVQQQTRCLKESDASAAFSAQVLK